jgi:hypothetical protein
MPTCPFKKHFADIAEYAVLPSSWELLDRDEERMYFAAPCELSAQTTEDPDMTQTCTMIVEIIDLNKATGDDDLDHPFGGMFSIIPVTDFFEALDIFTYSGEVNNCSEISLDPDNPITCHTHAWPDGFNSFCEAMEVCGIPANLID